VTKLKSKKVKVLSKKIDKKAKQTSNKMLTKITILFKISNYLKQVKINQINFLTTSVEMIARVLCKTLHKAAYHFHKTQSYQP